MKTDREYRKLEGDNRRLQRRLEYASIRLIKARNQLVRIAGALNDTEEHLDLVDPSAGRGLKP